MLKIRSRVGTKLNLPMATTRFNVVLDVPLTNAQKAAIDKDLQAVVRKHLAQMDNQFLGRKVIPRKEWLGIWLKRFGSVDRLKNSTQFNRYK